MFARKKHYVVIFSSSSGIDPSMCEVYVKARNGEDAIKKAKKKLFINGIYLIYIQKIDVEEVE